MPFQALLKTTRAGGAADLVHRQGDSAQSKSRDHDVGSAGMGVAADITRAVLDGVLPAEARLRWAAIVCAWVRRDADDTDAVFANNGDAALAAARMAMQPSRITLDELREGWESQGNAFHTPRRWLFEDGHQQGAGFRNAGALERRPDGGQLLVHRIGLVDG